MKNEKNISIVLTTYNGEKYLRQQLDSVFAQTLSADEVIAIDDCSNDNTLEILEEFHQKYNLIYSCNEYNLGVNANFEKALKQCTGNYICFCDQDDVWFPEKTETLYNKMREIEDEGPCIVTSRNTVVDSDLKIHYNTELKKDTSFYRDTIIYHLSQGASLLMNRKCLEYIFPFPANGQICYDFHIGYIIAMIGKKYDLKQSLMYYRVHGNNLTASLGKIRHNHSVLRKKRPTSVVANHFILTFKNANNQITNLTTPDRLCFVNRIIRISEESSYFKLLWLLLTTTHIPFLRKLHSLLRMTLNVFLNHER